MHRRTSCVTKPEKKRMALSSGIRLITWQRPLRREARPPKTQTMRRVLHTILFLGVAVALPLAGAPALLGHYKTGVLLAVGAILIWTQTPPEGPAGRLLPGLSLLSLAGPLAEWASPPPPPGPALSAVAVAGLSLMLGGLALRAWAFRARSRLYPSEGLIQRGPYRYIRHPAYAGAWLAFLGAAAWLEAYLGLAVAAAAMTVAYDYRIAAEETGLLRRYGTQYLAYRQRTKRMVPYVW